MSKHSATMQLAIPPQEAMNACRRGVDRLGWEITDEEAGRLTAGEEPPLTSCRALTWPVRVEIRIEPESSERTTVTIIASMTGYGSRPAQRLSNKIEVLEQTIRTSLPSAG